MFPLRRPGEDFPYTNFSFSDKIGLLTLAAQYDLNYGAQDFCKIKQHHQPNRRQIWLGHVC